MKRPLALVGFSYLLALLAALFFGEQSSLFLGCLMLAFFTAALFFPKLQRGMSIPASLLAVALAFGSFAAEARRLAPVEGLDGANAMVAGVVADLPYTEEGRFYYLLEPEYVGESPFPQGGKIMVCAKEPVADGPGSRICGEMRLAVPSGTEDGLSMRNSYRAKGILLYGFPVDEGAVTRQEGDFSWRSWLLSWKESLYGVAEEIFSREDAALVKALLFGDKHGLDPGLEEDFRTAGVSHLLAVSGMHMAVMSQLFTLLFRAAPLPRKLRPLGPALCIAAFMALTGFAPSVARSGIMYLVLLLGEGLSRRADSMNSLGFAVLLLCLANPYAAADIGLLLSAAATAGMLLLSAKTEQWLLARQPETRWIRRALGPVNSAVSTSVGAVLFTLPIILPLFGSLSPAALLSNILLLLPSTLLLQLSAGALVLGAVFPALAGPLAWASSLLCWYLRECAGLLASLPFASFSFSGRPALLWLACCLFLAGLAVLLAKRGKPRWRTVGWLCVILFLTSLLAGQLSLRNVTRAVAVPSGDGVALVLSRNGRAAVVGCGGYSASAVLRELEAQNIRSLDYLQMLEETYDECSRAGEILERFPVSLLVCREEALSNGRLQNALPSVGQVCHYSQGFSAELWDGAVRLEQKNGFVRILCQGQALLLWPKEGRPEDLPAGWERCTAALMSSLPQGWEKLQAEYGVFCMEEESVRKIWRADYPFLPLATADGKLEFRLAEGREIQVRREY